MIQRLYDEPTNPIVPVPGACPERTWSGRRDAFERVSAHVATAIGHRLHERGRLDRLAPRVISSTGF